MEFPATPVTNLSALTTSLGGLVICLRASQRTVELSGKNLFFENPAGGPGNHSYYLSFNDFEYSFIQFVFSSIYYSLTLCYSTRYCLV